MIANAPARAILAGAGLGVALAAGWWQAIISFGLIIVASILVGQFRLMSRILMAAAPLLGVATLLWLFIGAESWADLNQVAYGLLREGSPLLPLFRTLAGSAAIVLAFATTPDGELFSLLRTLRVPRAAATLIASGRSIAVGMPASYSRSLAALRAQGVVGPGAWAQFTSIGKVLSLTWVATLSTSFSRAEQKWVGNGFLRGLDPPPLAATKADAGRTVVLILTGVALLAVLLGGGP